MSNPMEPELRKTRRNVFILKSFFSSSTTAANPFLLFLSKKVRITPDWGDCSRFNITQVIKSYMEMREGSWTRNLPEANKGSRLFP